MPLDQEQQDKLQILKGDLHNLSTSMKTMTGQLDDQAVLSKLVTGGKKPDYDKFSIQDLRELYDRGVRSSSINTLPDGVDPETQMDIGPPHEHSVIATSSRGEKTSDLSREQLISGIDAMLEHEGYNFDPQRIATAQGMMVNAQAAMTDGGIDRAMLSYIKLQEDVPGFRDKDFESRLDAVKKEAAQFSQLTEKKCSDYVHAGLSTKLNELGKMKGDNSAEVDAALKRAQTGLDPTNFSGAGKHMQKTQRETLNLSGMNLTGVNLSASNLADVRVDATSLSRANGLDGVQGVQPRLLAEAQAIKPHVARLDDLNERMARLENKGGVLANLRNLRHGGVDGERKHLEKEIEKAQQALQQSKAAVAAQFPAPENEFEQKATYGIGGELSVRPETAESLAAKKSQASETFKVDSTQALDSRGTTFAIGKMGLGNKAAELQQAYQNVRSQPAPDPDDKDAVKARRAEIQKAAQAVEDAAAKDVNVLGTMGPLYGRETEVGDALGGSMVEDSAAKQAALGADPTTLLTRAVATSTVNKALGMDAVAEEKFAMDGNGQASTLSVVVPGAAILTRPTRENPQESFLKADYKDPDIQKGLFDLEAQDYITGQIDRHTGNIFVDPNSKEVRGIDNDLAFPTVNRDQMLHDDAVAAKAVATKPMFMHSDTADKIEALKPDDLRKALQNIETPGGVGALEPMAIEGAVTRLQELQDHIKDLRKDGRVVDKFNDETFRIAREEQIKVTPGNDLSKTTGLPPPASYLGAAIADTEKTLAINAEKPEDQRRKIVEKQDVARPQVDAKFVAYQKGVEDARANVAANPGQLQDAGLAKTITDGQAKLLKLQDDLQTHDQNLTASLARLNKARQDGDTEVARGLEKIFDKSQKARQEVLQEIKVEQKKVSDALDQAVEPMKPQIAAQARLATNQQQVAQPQNEIEAEVEVEIEANVNDQKLEASGEVKLEDSGEVKLEASNDIPLTQSQIDAIENEFGDIDQDLGEIDLDASGELQVEDDNPGIEMNEVPGEEQGIEAEGNNQQQDQPAVEAHAPANEPAQDQGQGQGGPDKKKSKFASVRDSIKNLAGTAKSTVAQKLESKGAEQPLHEVPSNKQAEYKSYQQQLNELKGGGDAIKAAGLMGPDPKAYKDFKKGDAEGGLTAPEIKERMDALKKEFPGLKQLDRSKVGQVVHSGVRDAAKSVGAKLKG